MIKRFRRPVPIAEDKDVNLERQRVAWYQSGAYEQCYHKGLFSVIWNLVYRTMERRFHLPANPIRVIEVGAGAGNYRPFVRHPLVSYVEVDQFDFQNAPNAFGVRRVRANVEVLDFASDGEFDRLIATCVLAHLDKPRLALAEWNRVVRPGGQLTIYVPPEGGLVTHLVRTILIWPKQKRLGLDRPRELAAIEHRYTFEYLRAIIKEEFNSFAKVEERRHPFGLPSHLALFSTFHISKGDSKDSKRVR